MIIKLVAMETLFSILRIINICKINEAKTTRAVCSWICHQFHFVKTTVFFKRFSQIALFGPQTETEYSKNPARAWVQALVERRRTARVSTSPIGRSRPFCDSLSVAPRSLWRWATRPRSGTATVRFFSSSGCTRTRPASIPVARVLLGDSILLLYLCFFVVFTVLNIVLRCCFFDTP